MKLIVLTEKYPYINDPVFTFLRNNLIELSKLGCECEVICPQSIIRPLFEKVSFRKKYWVDESGGIEIKVHQPLYFSYGPLFIKRSYKNFTKVVKSVVKDCGEFNAFYCKFWHMGVVANNTNIKKPIIVDCGESSISVEKNFDKEEIEDIKQQLSGIIYVSKKNYNEARSLNLQQNSQFIIQPNGIDTKKFFKRDKNECRDKLGWDYNAFITISVGNFIERKGINRVCAAIDSMDEEIYSVFIGDGKQKPNCKNLLFEGRVNNDELITYLSAADVFVLPTLHEGCCNAIIEALACGLPVISSNRDFNEGILNENNSILVDPENIDEIANAIKKLKNDKELREKLSYRSKEDIEKLDIKYRVKKIYDFISDIVK